MGHCLNNTIQDILIRRARMQGKNACWVPGTDHASIATEAKVVAMLREKGITKSSLSREEFLKYAWEWKEKYGGIILEQLKKMGCSLDWDRTTFTMDTDYYKSVIETFVHLHKAGIIYRGLRMVNWDPSPPLVHRYALRYNLRRRLVCDKRRNSISKSNCKHLNYLDCINL
jgi:valyl-tRNA synthetase